MPTNPTPVERLQRALEEYWPDGCKMFPVINNEKAIAIGWTIALPVLSRVSPDVVATIAAVAAAWWRVTTSNTDSQKVRLKSINATIEFLAIYEAATEVE